MWCKVICAEFGSRISYCDLGLATCYMTSALISRMLISEIGGECVHRIFNK